MGFHIYTIHNLLNNKIYVGKSENVEVRFKKHIEKAFSKREKERFYIHRAIARYGVNNFEFSVIQELYSEDECCLAEIYWIKFFNSKNEEFGYNQTNGGEGRSRKHTEATRQKIREKATGRKHTEETKEKLSKIFKGIAPAHIEAFKVVNVGRKLTKDHKRKVSEARKGMVFTDEHRENMSKAYDGRCDGEKSTTAKLTVQNVLDIREKFGSGKYTRKELAIEYKVSDTNIRSIINRSSWKNV